MFSLLPSCTYKSQNKKIDQKHVVRCITCDPKNDYKISRKQMRLNYINNQKEALTEQIGNITQTKPLFQQFTLTLNERSQLKYIPKQNMKTRTSNFFYQINSSLNTFQASQKVQANASEINKHSQKQVKQIIDVLKNTETMQAHLKQCENKRLDWQQAVQETMQRLQNLNSIRGFK